MLVLGIESSCDETACSVVQDGKKVLSSIISSQINIHAKFGGVVPEVASRQHLEVIDIIFKEALGDSILLSQIDAVACSQGPGLIGSLLVGISFAKGLAASLNKPLIPVDHVKAHVHGAMLGVDIDDIFPCLSLVVSGGHTNLYYMTGPLDFKLLARSLDDACGECFDKTAKLLGLSYPGGVQIEKLAEKGDPHKIKMPLMIEQKDRLTFSYSGLKTHMVNLIKSMDNDELKNNKNHLCASFQEEALGQLVRKLEAAIKINQDVKSILIAGGVAANKRFRYLVSKLNTRSFFPDLKYCSDNAAMIAAMGYYKYISNPTDKLWWNSWDAYSRYGFTL